MRPSGTLWSLVAVCGFTFAFYAGCGGGSGEKNDTSGGSTDPVTAFCDQQCDCTGCDDAELKDCKDRNEDSKQVAEEAGCGDQHAAFLECVVGNSICQDGQFAFGAGCETPTGEYQMCLAESEENECKDAVVYIADCKKMPPPTGSAACVGKARCQAECILDAPCGAFDGSDKPARQVLAQCAKACGGS